MTLFEVCIVGLISLAAGAGGVLFLMRSINRNATTQTVRTSITERIRAVGKLTGLEVVSKEIVTQTKGLNWLPQILLSQARLAMIFHFEKQYYVDLSRLDADAVRRTSGGEFVLTLPPVEGNLNLLEVIPYDIQSGKLLLLLDVLPMDAEAQKEMMQQAQEEAGRLYEENAKRYEQEARRTIARQVRGLLDLFDVPVAIEFADEAEPHSPVVGDQATDDDMNLDDAFELVQLVRPVRSSTQKQGRRRVLPKSARAAKAAITTASRLGSIVTSTPTKATGFFRRQSKGSSATGTAC